MASRKNIEERSEALLAPIVEPLNIRIYDMEYVKEGADWYLRAYIDKDGGITIDDCETVSRAFSDVLDAEDYIEDAYILEVSSPGLGRQLKKDRHLQYSIGEEVDIKLYEAIDGEKELLGVLKAFDKATITLEVEGKEQVFERGKIAKIHQHVEF